MSPIEAILEGASARLISIEDATRKWLRLPLEMKEELLERNEDLSEEQVRTLKLASFLALPPKSQDTARTFLSIFRFGLKG